MKNFIVFVIVFISSNGHSQSDKTTIGAHFHPGFSKVYNSFHSVYDYRFCYNAGIDFRTYIGLRGLYVESGLGWNEYGVKSTIPIADQFGNPIGESTGHTTYFFASLPLNLTYKIKGWHLSTGAMLSYYIMRKFVVEKVLIAKDQNNLSSWHAALNLKVGYEFKASSKWIVGVEGFSNLMLGPDLYNFGIGISGRYVLSTRVTHDDPRIN